MRGVDVARRGRVRAAFRRGGDRGASAPVYAVGYEITGAILAGLVQACADAGLDGTLLELIAAVRIALDRPTAGERWRRRLPVFALARDPEHR